MATHLPMHRLVLIIYNALIVAIMVAISAGTGALLYPRSPFLWLYIVIPLLIIAWSVADIEPRARIMGYWGFGFMLPILAGVGLFGGYGILYAINILVLLWTAWVENEGQK